MKKPKETPPKSLTQSVSDAIKQIKTCRYGGTFVKVELEAQLNRDMNCETCYDCDGSGDQEDENGDLDTCSSCDGTGETDGGEDGWGNQRCEAYMKRKVSAACRKATVFSRFLVDGSVDSEFTFTVPVDKPEYVLEYIYAFKALAKAIKGGLEVRGAGMHITILRSKDGQYPGNHEFNATARANFERSMTKLMPALLFLASPSHQSRGLSYRSPGIGRGSHRHAIDVANHGGSALFEWRVFETCYDRPEMFYDFLCVIAKGLAYYSLSPPPLKISSVGRIEFYDDSGKTGLHKYYHSETHLKLLAEGIEYLKPDHRTTEELYRLRNFTLSPETFAKIRQRISYRLESQWVDEGKNRADRRAKFIDDHMRAHYYGDAYTKTELASIKARLRRDFDRLNPPTKEAYIKTKLEQHLRPKGSSSVITI